jgi:hypothetical protein
LYAGHEYYYKIKGLFNNTKTVISSNYTNGYFDCLPPQNLRVLENKFNGVTLAWDPINIPDLQQIWIERADNLEFQNFRNIGVIMPVTSTSVNFTDIDRLENNKTYYYRIQWLTNKLVFSPYSNIVSNIYSNGPSYPGIKIQNLRITNANCNGIDLAWDDLPINYNELGYTIFRTVYDEYGSSVIKSIGYVAANTLTFHDAGQTYFSELQSNTSYEYYVGANFNNSYNTINSNHAITSVSCGPEINLTNNTIQNCNGITLNWNDLGIDFVETNYYVQRKGNGVSYYRTVAVLDPNITSYTDVTYLSERFIAGKNYDYRILAVKGAIIKASNEITASYNCTEVTNLVANSTCEGIFLNWSDLPQNISESGYVVYRAEGNINANYEGIAITSENITSFFNDDVINGKSYFYKIAGIKNNLEFNSSEVVSAQIDCFLPPSISVTSTSCGNIVLAWSNNNPDAQNVSYQLFRSTNGINGDFRFVQPKSSGNTHTDVAGDYVYDAYPCF